MSNNAPDYENNLAFDPDINTMPRCDIEELKGQIEQLKALNTADDYLIKLLEEENQQLKELLKECKANLIHKKQLLEKLDKLEKPTKELLTKIDEVLK